MTRNGNTNGYAQVFKGPDGQPMVLLRVADLTALMQNAAAYEKKKGRGDFVKEWATIDFTDSEEATDAIAKLVSCIGSVIHNITTDEDAYRDAKAALASGEDEVMPGDMVERLLAGEAPLKVWREHRGLKQTELAATTGVGQDVISKIENNKRTGDVATLKALAAGLGVLVDDLVI